MVDYSSYASHTRILLDFCNIWIRLETLLYYLSISDVDTNYCKIDYISSAITTSQVVVQHLDNDST
jgi:hypothetical protein